MTGSVQYSLLSRHTTLAQNDTPIMTSIDTASAPDWVQINGPNGSRFISLEQEALVQALTDDLQLECGSLDEREWEFRTPHTGGLTSVVTEVFHASDLQIAKKRFTEYTEKVLDAREQYIRALQRGGTNALERSYTGAKFSVQLASALCTIRLGALHDLWASPGSLADKNFLPGSPSVVDDAYWKNLHSQTATAVVKAWHESVETVDSSADRDADGSSPDQGLTGRVVIKLISLEEANNLEEFFEICRRPDEERGSVHNPANSGVAQNIWAAKDVLDHHRDWEKKFSDAERAGCLESKYTDDWKPVFESDPDDPSSSFPWSGPGGIFAGEAAAKASDRAEYSQL